MFACLVNLYALLHEILFSCEKMIIILCRRMIIFWCKKMLSSTINPQPSILNPKP